MIVGDWMKKLLLLVFVLGFLLVGCTKKEVAVDYEKIMKDYGQEYFDRYIVPYPDYAKSLDVFTVSYASLKNANEKVNAQFDLSQLKDCSDDTRVEMAIDKETTTVTNYEYYIECK
jgi:hypothetical protein